jgi:hypothetical protein
MTDFFPINSRYYGMALRSRTLPDGTTETFVARRIIPAMSRFRPLDRHRTIDNERIDGVAANSYGDPALYWRICDANGDREPADATTPAGRLLIIPLPLEIADDGNA